MSTEIYYFSGTGNSLAIARSLAESMGASLQSMASVMDHERITPGADAVGMVFPVYHKSIPLILKRFVQKLENLEGKYLFAVCTYGDTVGLGHRHLAALLESRGGRLAAGSGVHMPYNYLTPGSSLTDFYASFTLREVPIEKQQALLAAVPAELEHIVARLTARQTGEIELTSDILTRLADYLGVPETLGKSTWLKIAGIQERTDLSFIESRQLMDRAFHVDESCIGCGTCARVCPVANIEMIEEAGAEHATPAWQQRCEQCFACLHWCPQEAVQFGNNTAGRQRYHHPDVKLADMLRQPAKAQ